MESSRKSEQVLAMPLYRIPQYWEELTSVADRAHGLCVVLAPAGRDYGFFRDVVEQVLASLNLDMHLSSLEQATTQDLDKIERATLVIADGTSRDADVMMALTVAQGLGTPDVVVSTGPVDDDQVRRHPSLLRLDVTDVGEARRSLTERLVTTLGVFDAVGELISANPITNFFGAPLTRVSAANALALGYFKNFVAPVGRLLVQAVVGRDVTIKVGSDVVDLDSEYRGVFLQIVLPDQLGWASDKGIRARLRQDERFVDAEVISPYLSRPRPLKALREKSTSGSLVLVDVFPTTMATMIDSINERFAGRERRENDPETWRAIERKEIDRFSTSLARRITDDPFELDDVTLADVCHVVAARELFPDLVNAS